MAAIDRDLLLAEVKFYLGYVDEFNPGMNVLPDATILTIAESIILEVGDDDLFYPEVKCKTIQACAIQNQTLSKVNRGRGVRREESNKREVEFFNDDPSTYWQDFLDMLPSLCSSFGYCDLPSAYKGRFYTSVAKPVRYPAGARQIGSRENIAYPDGEPKVDGIDD